MFADDKNFELLQPLLEATMAAVNASLKIGEPKLSCVAPSGPVR